MDNQRVNHLLGLVSESSFDAIVINPGSSLFFLTGLDFHLMERPVLLFLVPGHDPVIIHPELEKQKLKHLTFPAQTFPYGDNPATWVQVIQQAAKYIGLDGKKIGLEPACLRYLELDLLKNAISNASFASAEDILTNLRLCKSNEEISSMQNAVDIAQDALLKTIPLIHKGQSEKEIANRLVINLLQSGSQPNLPFMPIVSAGAHSADPHAVPTDTRLESGDMLVIDWGARYGGYISDLTRTFAIEKLDENFRSIGQSVAQANQTGCAAVKPGISAGQVDDQTRKVLIDNGYAQFFTHRTGHGIGLEPHESPYIFSENQLFLQPGMTFTIEPGVYLPEIGGVRIEDNVVVTQDGVRILSNLSREIKIIG